jgi:transposase
MIMSASKITHEQLREELSNGLTRIAIAIKYDMSERRVYKQIAQLKATGYDPDNERYHKNPEDQNVKGYSTLVRMKNKEDDSIGKVLEWVKTNVALA